MSKIAAMLVAGVLLAVGFSTLASGSSVVLNGGFELGTGSPVDWTQSGTSYVTISSTYVHSGTYGLGLDNNGSTASIAQTLSNLTVGHSYTVSFYYSTATDIQANWLKPYFEGNLLTSSTGIVNGNGNSGFALYSYTATVTGVGPTANVPLEFDWNTGGGNYLGLDDISVTDGGVAPAGDPRSTPLPAASGAGLSGLVIAGGLVLRRSRKNARTV